MIKEGDGEDTFVLCYSAVIEFNADKFPKFKAALEFSSNQVEIKIGFKLPNGDDVDDEVCEGYSDIPIELKALFSGAHKEASDDGDDDEEKDDLDRVLDEMMEEDGEDDEGDDLDRVLNEMMEDGESSDLPKKTVKLTFKNVGGEFQYHRLNKEDSEYLKNEFTSDKDSFLETNLQGGESFEEAIWPGSYGPSMNDIEIINDEDNKKINLDKVNKNQIFYTDGEDDVRSECLDYFYITEGKIFGSYAINLSDGENFDPEKLTINYIEYSLDGYPEKFGTIIHEVEYDGETCDMEIEDNGVEIYRSIFGYELFEDDLEDYIVIYDSDHQTTWKWDLFDKVFS